MREALMIPRGPRGPHAPHLEPVHMARLLIGLTASDTAPGVTDIVPKYATMSAIGDRMFPGGEDFETALAEIFKGETEDGRSKFDPKEVIVCRSWPEATIVLADGREFKFSTLEPPPYEKRWCRMDYHVGQLFFHEIHSALETEKGHAELKAMLKTNEDVEAYGEWKAQIIKIGNEQGEDAARKWAEENPFKGGE